MVLSGAEARVVYGIDGTAKAVPFHETICEIASQYPELGFQYLARLSFCGGSTAFGMTRNGLHWIFSSFSTLV